MTLVEVYSPKLANGNRIFIENTNKPIQVWIDDKLIFDSNKEGKQ